MPVFMVTNVLLALIQKNKGDRAGMVIIILKLTDESQNLIEYARIIIEFQCNFLGDQYYSELFKLILGVMVS